MTTYREFCQRYELDPETEEARAQYWEAQRQLDLLERAAARHEARVAIERAQKGEAGR